MARTALSGAEREERAGERLAEARQQLAAIQARMGQAQTMLDALSRLEQSAAAQVTAAEQAYEEAQQRVVDAHAAVLVAVGTLDEAQLTADHSAAVAARKAARKQLEEARAVLEATRQKVQSESAPIKKQIAEDDELRGDLQRQIQSFERLKEQAHRDAGLERLQAAKERHEALQARLVEHEQAAKDIRSDLDAHGAELQAILAAHPELKNSAEYRAACDPHRALKEILGSYAGYVDAVLHWYLHPQRADQQFNSMMLAQTLTNGATTDYHSLANILANMASAPTGNLTAALREARQWVALYAWQPKEPAAAK